MDNTYPENVTNEAMKGLIEKLNLPKPDAFSQDWEYEVSDSSRLSEFISFYENGKLNEEEKFALMIIIVCSYNDALSEGHVDKDIWANIRYHLLTEIKIHKNTMLYWALEGEDLEDCFLVTPLMREIVKA